MLSSAWYPLPRKSLPKKRLEKGATDLVGGRSATMSLTLTNPGAVSARRTRACGSPAAAQRDHQQAYHHFLGCESTILLILRRLVSRQSRLFDHATSTIRLYCGNLARAMNGVQMGGNGNPVTIPHFMVMDQKGYRIEVDTRKVIPCPTTSVGSSASF